jgi:sigma-B regulation protein RsbU (phosphoserine phosphatase)
VVVLHPKRFYRELETLLQDIEGGKLGPDWYPWMIRQILDRFGDELAIENGRVWVEDEGGYRLEFEIGIRDHNARDLVVPYDYPPVQLVLEHRVYMFDRSTPGIAADLEDRLGGLESAAILIPSEPTRILAFGLKPGWNRDPLDFAFNTIRNAVVHRLRYQDLAFDLEQAAEIQRSLLPRKWPKLPGYAIAARSDAASSVGGDFYDFLQHDTHTIVIALGDASGHGLSAALLARDVVTGIRMGAERSLKITETIHRLNRVIAQSALSTRFVSLFYAELEANGNVFYVNAGHPSPWIVGQREARRLSVGGPILGPLTDARFERGWAHVDRGDTLLAVTDGFLERSDGRGRHFDETGVEEVLEKTRGAPAPEVLDALFDAARRHGNGAPWTDDTSAVAITRDKDKPTDAEQKPEAGTDDTVKSR